MVTYESPDHVVPCLPLPSSAATVTIYQGTVSVLSAGISQVEGVAVLNLADTTTSHFFDCSTTQGSNANLAWSKQGGTQRFDTSLEVPMIDGSVVSTFRMNLAPPNEEPFGPDDVGLYICTDTMSSESASVYIAAGKCCDKIMSCAVY